MCDWNIHLGLPRDRRRVFIPSHVIPRSYMSQFHYAVRTPVWDLIRLRSIPISSFLSTSGTFFLIFIGANVSCVIPFYVACDAFPVSLIKQAL